MKNKISWQWFATCIGLFLSVCSSAQDKTVTYLVDPASNPPELIVALKHLKAEVRFVPAENKVIARTDFTFVPIQYQADSMVFYAPDFKVNSAFVDKKKVDFKMSGSNLIIDLRSVKPEKSKEYHLILDYDACPQSGMIYFVGWKPWEEGKTKEIWAHRPHGWLPYMDSRITMDMYYTFDSSFSIFANGERVGIKDNHNGTRTWNYRMTKDHPFFSTAVVIGPYDFKTSCSAGGVPLEFWYYRGQENKVKTTYAYTEAMMDFYEKEIGVCYPYQVYRQAPVIDYMYGAMETTTSTIFGDYMLIDRGAFWQRNYINTNAHEMAHQWFGNAITQLVNKDVWLTESFATYYAKIFERS
ncbi:MAG: M1 family aminopeptidase, partial [Bacteroidota bacterium]|nr:M1 family aminopeptidase [Bacteroidota bacterium]